MSYTVYKITSPNGKIYIGATSQTLERRFSDGNGYVFNQEFYKDIKKYGWGSFKTETLYITEDKKEAQLLEKKEIKKHDSTSFEKGYNTSKGVAIVIDPKYSQKHNPLNANIGKKIEKSNELLVRIFDLAEKILLLNNIAEDHPCGETYRNQLKKVIMSKFEYCTLARIMEEEQKIKEIKKRQEQVEITLFLSAEKIIKNYLGEEYEFLNREKMKSLFKKEISKLREHDNIGMDIPKRYKITLV